jgi:hypothetical protein
VLAISEARNVTGITIQNLSESAICGVPARGSIDPEHYDNGMIDGSDIEVYYVLNKSYGPQYHHPAGIV